MIETVFTYLLISLLINLALFIPAFIYKTDKLTDLSYSISFIAILTALLWNRVESGLHLIPIFMVLIWSLRLGVFLWIRIHQMDRDKRFDGIRESFSSFLKFWLLQGFTAWFISLPVIFICLNRNPELFYPGIGIWLTGLIIESVADAQKLKFRNSKSYPGQFIQTGLWKYSRHPNYFGEIMVWIGIFITVMPSFNLVEIGISMASVLFISSMLIFFTGIPPLERKADEKWGNLKSYQEYKEKTALLIPGLPTSE